MAIGISIADAAKSRYGARKDKRVWELESLGVRELFFLSFWKNLFG
jgi:hypothetical protein